MALSQPLPAQPAGAAVLCRVEEGRQRCRAFTDGRRIIYGTMARSESIGGGGGDRFPTRAALRACERAARSVRACDMTTEERTGLNIMVYTYCRVTTVCSNCRRRGGRQYRVDRGIRQTDGRTDGRPVEQSPGSIGVVAAAAVTTHHDFSSTAAADST